MPTPDLESLRSRLHDPASLILDQARLEPYEHDETFLKGKPVALVMATSAQDVQAAVRFASENDLPIVPRGAGTGLSGGCVPANGALVISTELLDAIQIFPADRVAICGPGVITKHLKDQAETLNLTYPPDPASYEESTLGGNVAENAGGLRCKRYGVTRDYILGLEAVTIDGSLIRTGWLAEQDSFNLTDLLIGSEGTLAIVTNIALQLIELPSRGNTILLAFDTPANAAQTVTDITTSGMIPTVLEFLDGLSVSLANDYEKMDGIDRAEGVLLIETSDQNAQFQTDKIKQIANKNRCSYLRVESDPQKADTLWAVRRNMAYAAKAASVLKLSEDIAVPNSQFPTMVAFVAELNKTHSIRMNCYGHAGDGNLHVNLLADDNSAATIRLMDETVEIILKKAIELGGTLSGEHGIGLTKSRFLPLEFDPATLGFMSEVKRLFDPNNLMNPGKLFASTPPLYH